MSDILLFRVDGGKAVALPGKASDLEKPLQNLIETNLEALLGVRILASEHSTGKTHAGRIDTLGIDENNCPVIIEYKRSVGENVINQGLFYLNWLMDHKAEFELLVLKKYGQKVGNVIDWLAPRLICIASDFTKYDAHAVQQMQRNIELVRYKQFGGDLLLLEQVNATTAPQHPVKANGAKKTTGKVSVNSAEKTILQVLSGSPEFLSLFGTIEGYITSLGDDIQRNNLKFYVAFKRLRNFACVGVKKDGLCLWLKLDAATTLYEPGFSRDVRNIGHWGTGDVEIIIKSHADIDKAKPFIQKAYEG